MSYHSRRYRIAWRAAAAALWAAAAGLAVPAQDAYRAELVLGAAITVSIKCVVDGRAHTNYRATLGLLDRVHEQAGRLHALTEGLTRAFAAAEADPEDLPAEPGLRLVGKDMKDSA